MSGLLLLTKEELEIKELKQQVIKLKARISKQDAELVRQRSKAIKCLNVLKEFNGNAARAIGEVMDNE